jgi:ATP-binding cassette subfamily B protein
VPAAGFREWAASEDYLRPVGVRLAALGVANGGEAQREAALAAPGWRSLAALDAAARYVEQVVRSGGISRGAEAARLVDALLEQTRHAPWGEDEPIPECYWTARPGPPDDDGEAQVLLSGAVLVSARGRKDAQLAPSAVDVPADNDEQAAPRALSPELAAALAEPANQSWRLLWRMLREDGLLAPAALAFALTLATGGNIVEALLFRGLLQVGHELPLPEVRLGAAAVVLVFLAVMLVLERSLSAVVLDHGRRLETRLRVAFLAKIPRLGDRYFQSRPASDMAERGHTVHVLRGIPLVAAEIHRALSGVVVTVVAIIWVDRGSALPALVIAALALLIPLLANRALIERDLRVRTHAGALTRFYLDALLGLVPIRAHAAERAVRREHESLLGEWALAGRSMLRTALTADGVTAALGAAAAIWLLFDHVAREGAGPRALLLVYWALELPSRGQELAAGVRQYPAQRNIALRLLEPIGAPDDVDLDLDLDLDASSARASASAAPRRDAVALAFEAMSVHAGGHAILDDVTLEIAAGSHVAIVGPSGAGKSSLVGVLLGWHRAAAGRVLVDGLPLDGAEQDRLRRATAWVDPAIQIWNRSFLDNVRYGQPATSSSLGDVLEDAELRGVLGRLPEGQQTMLGEGGGLVSGGEGQRVRLGRAMLRRDARLVILDEPFRGLDRALRGVLLARARRLWQRSTLLCVTHDVGETLTFARVLVVDGGRVVEDGDPAELAAQPGSRYRALLDAEDEVRNRLWSDVAWRRLRVEDGLLVGPLKSEGS